MNQDVIQHALASLAPSTMPLSQASRERPWRLVAVIDGRCIVSFHRTESDAEEALAGLSQYFGERVDVECSGHEEIREWPVEEGEAGLP